MANSYLPEKISEGDSLSEMSLISLTEKLTNSGELAKAKVIIPSDNELTVTLVNVNLIRRLDELREDESIFQNSLFMVLGTLIGTVVTVLTSGKPISETNGATITGVVILSVVCGFLNIVRKRAADKSSKIKKKLFNDDEINS